MLFLVPSSAALWRLRLCLSLRLRLRCAFTPCPPLPARAGGLLRCGAAVRRAALALGYHLLAILLYLLVHAVDER